jgi:hypothetical protein
VVEDCSLRTSNGSRHAITTNRLIDGVAIWLGPTTDRTATPSAGRPPWAANDALWQIAHVGLFDGEWSHQVAVFKEWTSDDAYAGRPTM